MNVSVCIIALTVQCFVCFIHADLLHTVNCKLLISQLTRVTFHQAVDNISQLLYVMQSCLDNPKEKLLLKARNLSPYSKHWSVNINNNEWSQIYTDSLQLSNAFLCTFVAESVLHLPLPSSHPHPPPKNGSARIPWPNTAWARWARAHPSAHQWLRYCSVLLTAASVHTHRRYFISRSQISVAEILLYISAVVQHCVVTVS